MFIHDGDNLPQPTQIVTISAPYFIFYFNLLLQSKSSNIDATRFFTVCRLKIKKIFVKNFLSFIDKKSYNLCCNLTMFHQMSSLTKNIKPEKTTPASRYSKHTTDANQRYNHTTTRWQTLWYMSLHLPLHWKKATHQYSEDHYFDVHKAHFQQTKIS